MQVLQTPKQRNKKLTDPEKASIIESYRLGVSPTNIAAVLMKSPTQITTFYSRWKLYSTLLPRVIVKNNLIQGRLGLTLKGLVRDFPRLSVVKLARKLNEMAPGININPFKSIVWRYLQENGFASKTAALKPPTSDRIKKLRLDFANLLMENGV
jgi:hypothetical protein